jgi:hypothetical protein
VLRRFRGSGYEKTQSGLRSLCVFSPPHFLCAGIASQFLYRAQKTSHTAGTLGASFRIGWKIVDKIKLTMYYKKGKNNGKY